MGGKALPALRASGTPEARAAIEAVLAEAERIFREANAGPEWSCRSVVFFTRAESRRWVGELEEYLPGCRIRAGFFNCMHRRQCHEGGLFIYGVAEDDAEVFVIKRGRSIGDALLRRLAPVPAREEELARTLAGGHESDRLIFDTEGRLVRVER